ncbi:YgiW/YdeI family stress tolerance OB fold protein [Vibrio sinaloensis]|uniref:YgiW/YdeI family stress tolerance OB fold protein n=1 Tax=Photobacterium sp. (strain ATCC 43367) TaxID=379097 RepID=UPI0020671E42|nr:NirD/YgiW/YdeI family stress tolerance protein [Vibrio sinaloensis]UPQ89922.1 NirD/YgiW/YdeI family stress tolerance protein [Vibrio sinaloensis]
MKKIVLATALSLIFAPALVMAKDNCAQQMIEYKGPVDTTTVASLLQDTKVFGERDVAVEGVLIRQIAHDTFIFSDGNDEIEVELDDGIVLSKPLDNQTRVRLFGEYEGGSEPEIEVKHIQVL